MATGYYLLDNPQHRNYPQCGYPRRGGAKASGTIILHDAEGGTDLVGADMGAENVARYILERASYGSYHDLVDRDTHIPMAPIDYETWHSVPDNPWTVGICIAWTKADLAKMTYAQRRSYYVPLARVVLKRVADFARRGIKVPIDRMLTAAETQARRPGISTHSRTDPSRRSDPFGTGSKYETEFLAVLAELDGTTTPEEDMTPAESARLKNVEATVEKLAKALLKTFEDAGQDTGLVDGVRKGLILGRRNFVIGTRTELELEAYANKNGVPAAELIAVVKAAAETAFAEAVEDGIDATVTFTNKEN